jgi:hypothetical protein
MHALILSQSQLDQLDHLSIRCTQEARETPKWHSLWRCIRNVPGDVCRCLYFMRFSLLLWLLLPTLTLPGINPGIALIADSYRIPVLTLTVTVILLMNIFPAFTFNTTAVGAGNRVLLSNYSGFSKSVTVTIPALPAPTPTGPILSFNPTRRMSRTNLDPQKMELGKLHNSLPPFWTSRDANTGSASQVKNYLRKCTRQ